MQIQRPQRFLAWSMWAIASIFYAFQYTLRVLPNIMMPEIMGRFQIDADIFGQFSGVYYLAYSAAHIPLAIMLDRIGPRIVMPVCTILTVIGLLPLIYTEFWIYPLLGRCLIGMGSSAAILGVFKVIRIGFREDQFTRMLGIAVTIGLLGAIYGGQPLNYMLKTMGEEAVILGVCAMGIFMAIGMYILFPTLPKEESQEHVPIKEQVQLVFKNRMFLGLCLFGACMLGPLEGFADVWGTEYLKVQYGLSDNVASSMPSFIFFGMCFGAAVLSYLADIFKSHSKVIIGSGIVMALGFVYLMTGYMHLSMMAAVLTIVGIACAYQIPLIYKASTYVEEKARGVAMSVANMIIMTFGYVIHSSIGQLLTLFWQGQTTVEGVPFYDASTYTTAISVIPIGLGIGVIGLSFLFFKKKGSSL